MASIRCMVAAAVIGSGFGGAASALELVGAPSDIEGVKPGMSLAEVRTHVGEMGMVMIPGKATRTGGSGDVRTESGELAGTIFSFGNPETLEIIHVEVGAVGDMETVYRVSAMIPAKTKSNAWLDELGTAFGKPNCGVAEYRLSADWTPVEDPACGIRLFEFMTPMSLEGARMVAAKEMAAYTAMLTSTPGNDRHIVTSVQDNMLTANARLAVAGELEPAQANDDVAALPEENDAEGEGAVLPERGVSSGDARGVAIMDAAPGNTIAEVHQGLIDRGFKVRKPSTQYSTQVKFDESGDLYQPLSLTHGALSRKDTKITPIKERTYDQYDGKGGRETVTLHALETDVIWMVSYEREFPKDGPYAPLEQVDNMLKDRAGGLEPMETAAGEQSLWVFEQDGSPRKNLRCIMCMSAYGVSGIEAWKTINAPGNDTSHLDYQSFKAKIGSMSDQTARLVYYLRLNSTNAKILVDHLSAEHAKLVERTAPDSQAIEF